jgi:26S proteasome regulatory subunit N10
MGSDGADSRRPSLLVTPTNDLGKLLSALGKSTIGGISDFQTSVQIAQLALKHRENKNQRQRIVVFVGSPLDDSQESLVKLGKKLRKNNVLVDVVVFGDEGMENEGKLGALVDAAGAGESWVMDYLEHILS